ncbi:MAG TPA: YceI family protein [Candidatus Kapabacteria bacterium]|nr:YceI family protein [Candidatus Kapabacteria bacterium]
MMVRTGNLKSLAAALLLLTAASLSAQVRYQATPGSTVKLDGTSTVHDWTVEGKIIGGFVEFESEEALDPAKTASDVKAKVEVNIPVSSLQSGKKLMNEIMHDALKIKDHKAIKYALKEIKPQARKAGEPLKFDTKGDLTVAGVTKPIDMVVTLVPEGNKLKATGSKQLKMTDFGIKPPSPAVGLGLIKTADEVTVTFEWNTAKKEAKTASAN